MSTRLFEQLLCMTDASIANEPTNAQLPPFDSFYVEFNQFYWQKLPFLEFSSN